MRSRHAAVLQHAGCGCDRLERSAVDRQGWRRCARGPAIRQRRTPRDALSRSEARWSAGHDRTTPWRRAQAFPGRSSEVIGHQTEIRRALQVDNATLFEGVNNTLKLLATSIWHDLSARSAAVSIWMTGMPAFFESYKRWKASTRRCRIGRDTAHGSPGMGDHHPVCVLHRPGVDPLRFEIISSARGLQQAAGGRMRPGRLAPDAGRQALQAKLAIEVDVIEAEDRKPSGKCPGLLEVNPGVRFVEMRGHCVASRNPRSHSLKSPQDDARALKLVI